MTPSRVVFCTVLDVGNPSYWDALLPVFVEVMSDRVGCVAFPAEAAAEMRDEKLSTLDDPGKRCDASTFR